MPEQNNNNQNQQEGSIIKVAGVDFKKPDILKEDKIFYNPTRIRQMDDFMTYEITAIVPYTDAADANYYPVFYVATQQCYILEAKLRHSANSTSGVVDIEKLATGVARGSGVSMIASTFSIASGANTVQRRLPTSTLADSQLAPGDAMVLKATGTLTNGEHVTVTILLGINNQNIPVSANIN